MNNLTQEVLEKLEKWCKDGRRSVKIEMDTSPYGGMFKVNIIVYDYDLATAQIVKPEEVDRINLLDEKKRQLEEELKKLKSME